MLTIGGWLCRGFSSLGCRGSRQGGLLDILSTAGLIDLDKVICVTLNLSKQRMLVWYHDVEDLRQHFHYLSEGIGAVLQLPGGQVSALEQGANLEEELERVFFVFHVRVVAHLSDQLCLDALKIVTEDVVEDDVVQRRDQLHDRVRRVLVNEACHRRILQVLQLVAQVDRVRHLGVSNVNSLLVLDFVLEELPEVGLLG